MRLTFPVVLGFFATMILLGSCSKQSPGLNTYDVSYSDRVSFDKDKRLRFSDVISDNRCPVDAMCITAGEAIIEFQGICNGDTIPFNLHLGGAASGPSDTLIFEEYRVELLEVLPLPAVGTELEKEDYECRVLVEKLP